MRGPSIACAAVLTVALAACGGGGDDSASTTTAAEADATTTTAVAAATSVDVDETVWFAGFALTFGEASFSLDPSPIVEIATEFENTGTETARLDATLVLTAAGESVESVDATDIPDVPGGTTGKGSIRFDVDPNFSFDDAVLTIGREGNNQAVVPLGEEGELVTLEPAPVAVTGSATAGQLKIDVHGGELRADIPESHGQVPAEQLALTLDFDITNSGTGGGGYAFVPDNLALTLPDGTTVAPDDSPIELLGHQATLRDQQVRFLVDNPAAGSYVLLLREGQTEGQVPFTLT
jgi:hypothetical protein